METSSCVLIGAARGIADKLPKSLATMTQIAALWSKSAIVIAENGSTDGTKAILETFRQSDPDRHRILTLDAEANAIPARTMRLALVRNRLLEYIHAHYTTYEYILMVDLDGILDDFDIHSIGKALKTPEPWDALFANSAGKYYDIWALRSAGTLHATYSSKQSCPPNLPRKSPSSNTRNKLRQTAPPFPSPPPLAASACTASPRPSAVPTMARPPPVRVPN